MVAVNPTAGCAVKTESTSHFGRVRRVWIEFFCMPSHDSALTPDQWHMLQRRWERAGGDPDEFDHLIEKHVPDY